MNHRPESAVYQRRLKFLQEVFLETAPDPRAAASEAVPELSEAVMERLVGLRLLSGVPFIHLVPAPGLLVQESIRFFFIDPQWTSALICGALSSANIGSAEQRLSGLVLNTILERVDARIKQKAGIKTGERDPLVLSGMLIRSELVKRWPGMGIRAFAGADVTSQRLSILRQERLDDSVMIVVFSGLLRRLELREPLESARFGVELNADVDLNDDGTIDSSERTKMREKYSLNPRKDSGAQLNVPPIKVPLRANPTLHVLDIAALTTRLGDALGETKTVISYVDEVVHKEVTIRNKDGTTTVTTVASTETKSQSNQVLFPLQISSSRLALSLQQASYVQVFK